MLKSIPTLCCAATLGLAGFTPAQVDYDDLAVDVLIGWDDVGDFTRQDLGGVFIRSLATDEQGRLYFYTQDDEFDPDAKLVRADFSSEPPMLETMATEAQILAVLDTNFLPPGVPCLAVASDGTIFLEEFMRTPDFLEDIVRITPGRPSTVEGLHRRQGVSGMVISPDGSRLILTPAIESEPVDLVSIPIAGGEETIIASEDAITAATGGDDACLRGNVMIRSDGHILVWDESDCGGTDQLLQVSPEGETSVLLTTEQVLGGEGGYWLAGNAIDENDTLYFVMTRHTTGDLLLIVIEDGGLGERHAISRLDIMTAARDSGRGIRLWPAGFGNGLIARNTEDGVTLWLNSVFDQAVVEIRFPKASPGTE